MLKKSAALLRRKEKNVTQDVLANFLGVSYQSVSKWERGVSQT